MLDAGVGTMLNRIHWGAIFAGVIAGLGTCLAINQVYFAFIYREPFPPGGPSAATLTPLNGMDAFLAILIAAVGFAVMGTVTTLSGRFPRRSQALLHAFTTVALSLLVAHFVFRDTMLLGRPGFPFNTNSLAVQRFPVLPATRMTMVTIGLSTLVGLVVELATAVFVQQRFAREFLLDEISPNRRAAAP